MNTLKKSLSAWKSNTFKEIFVTETLELSLDTIPLYLATEQGGIIKPESISLSILSTSEDDNNIKIKAGFFFTEIIGGCNCDDDPSEANVYCVFLISIKKTNASCSFLIQEY